MECEYGMCEKVTFIYDFADTIPIASLFEYRAKYEDYGGRDTDNGFADTCQKTGTPH
jgi:hypothetical protein